MKRALQAALAALLLASGSGTARAQTPVRFEGLGDVAIDRRIERLLARAEHITITRDTLIADTVPTTLLVLGATLTLEGVVYGDVVAVDAQLFLRPGSVVTGDVVNAGGGLYPSELARVGRRTIDLPTARYTVEQRADATVIHADFDRARLRLEGAFGFGIPTYDRVNGLAASWAATYALPGPLGITPRLRGEIGWSTERGELLGGGGLLLERDRTTLETGWYRELRTNERWIRSAFNNSFKYAWGGTEYWNHYQADVAFAELRTDFVTRAGMWTPRLRLELEDGTSLEADDPWFLWERDRVPRPNPAIDDGRITSLAGGVSVVWEGRVTAAEVDAAVEVAREVLGGDFEYAAARVTGEFDMAALRNHRLELEWHARAPLPGSDPVPRQRWSYAGGFGALQTLTRGVHLGDHVVYVETAYIIPFPPRWRLPLLGAPDLELLHGAGMGWTQGAARDLEQNVGARLQFTMAYVRYMVDPTDPSDADLDIGVSWPF